MVDCARVVSSCFLAIFVILIVNGVFVDTSSEKEIPITKVGLGTNVGPTLKFLYW